MSPATTLTVTFVKGRVAGALRTLPEFASNLAPWDGQVISLFEAPVRRAPAWVHVAINPRTSFVDGRVTSTRFLFTE